MKAQQEFQGGLSPAKENWEQPDIIKLQKGIPLNFIQLKTSELFEVLRCGVCSFLCYKPMVCVNCSQCYCHSCLLNHLQVDKRCINCTNVFKNGIIDSKIMEVLRGLQIKCFFQEEGCKLSIVYDSFEHHVMNCGKRPRKCQICGLNVLQENIDNHLEQCQNSERNCKYCLKKMPYRKLFQHEEKCKGIEGRTSYRTIIDKIQELEQRQINTDDKLNRAYDKIHNLEKENKNLTDQIQRLKLGGQSLQNSQILVFDENKFQEIQHNCIQICSDHINQTMLKNNIKKIQIPLQEECDRIKRKIEQNGIIFTLVEEEKQNEKGLIGATFDISDSFPIMSNTNYSIEFIPLKLQGLAIIGFRLDDQEMLNVSSNGEFYHYWRSEEDDSLWSGKLVGTINFTFQEGDNVEILYNSSGLKFTLLNKTQKNRYTCDIRKFIEKGFLNTHIKIMASLSIKDDSLSFF